MPRNLASAQAQANYARYEPTQPTGFYESFFQRANHPTRPLAFWIRYTLFSPQGRPDDAIGELWAIYFDGETGNHKVVKREVPFKDRCHFDPDGFSVMIEESRLNPGRMLGSASSAADSIAWDLTFRGGEDPLFLLPLGLYNAPLPKAKSLVGMPMAVFHGSLRVNDQSIEINDWTGSQNHNWGTKHTDHYAWGQVAGFDNHPDSFLEVATARLKLGPLWTPPMTPVVLRHAGKQYALNSLPQTLRAKGSVEYFVWNFRSENRYVLIEGILAAPAKNFVALAYNNPPGGQKHCLNSKLARCSLKVHHKHDGKVVDTETLVTEHRAAFEILTDDRTHGVALRA